MTAAGGTIKVLKIGTEDEQGNAMMLHMSNTLIHQFSFKLLALQLFTAKGHQVIMHDSVMRIQGTAFHGLKDPKSNLYFLKQKTKLLHMKESDTGCLAAVSCTSPADLVPPPDGTPKRQKCVFDDTTRSYPDVDHCVIGLSPTHESPSALVSEPQNKAGKPADPPKATADRPLETENALLARSLIRICCGNLGRPHPALPRAFGAKTPRNRHALRNSGLSQHTRNTYIFLHISQQQHCVCCMLLYCVMRVCVCVWYCVPLFLGVALAASFPVEMMGTAGLATATMGFLCDGEEERYVGIKKRELSVKKYAQPKKQEIIRK